MGSLADHITAGLYPNDEDLSLADRLLQYFAGIHVGEGPPPAGLNGAPLGSEYTDVLTGKKYVKQAGGWVEVGTGGGGGGAVRIEDENVTVIPAATAINFAGAGVAATDAGSGEVTVTIPGAAGIVAPVLISSTAVGMVPLTLRGFAGQTGNLEEWKNSADVVLSAVKADGSLLLPNGTAANPAVAFGADPDTGLFLGAVGDLRLDVGGQTKVTATDNGVDGSIITDSRGGGSIGWRHNAVNKLVYFANLLTASVPILEANGTVTNPPYSFTADVDSGMFLNAVGDLRLAVGGQAKVVGLDDGTDGSVQLLARGAGSVDLQSGGTSKLNVNANRLLPSVPVQAPDGSIVLPSYSFAGATTTGLARLLNKLAVVHIGVEVANFDANGILLPNGAAATPSYSFINDVDTGMYLNAVGDLRLMVGGEIRVKVDDDGVNGGVDLRARGTGRVVARGPGGAIRLTVTDTEVRSERSFRSHNGSPSDCAYASYNSVNSGIWFGGQAGDIRLSSAGQQFLEAYDDGTNLNTTMHVRGSGTAKLAHAGVAKLSAGAADVLLSVPLRLTEQAAPAAAGNGFDYLYAGLDENLYFKDDGGVEYPLALEPINAQVGTTYQIVLADNQKLVTLTNAAAITVTLPQDSTVAIPIGSYIDIMQGGIGAVSIVAGVGATIQPAAAKLRTVYSRARVQKVAANTWQISGDLNAADSPNARVYRTTTQSIANVTATAVSFTTARQNVGTMWNIANPTRLTIPPGWRGLWSVGGDIVWAANVTGARTCSVRLTKAAGGTLYIATQGVMALSTAGYTTDMSVASEFILEEGDYLELVGTQASGGAININPVEYSGPELWASWIHG